MFGSESFYFGITKKMVIVFGSIFAHITIKRTTKEGIDSAVIKVPIQYAAKDKMLTRVLKDPELDQSIAVILPRMAFEILDITPARNRQLPTLNRPVKNAGEPNKLKFQYVPVPFDIKFALYVYVKNAEDGTKIIEQIYPYFRPDWTATVELIKEMDEVRDIPFTLDNTSLEDRFDGAFADRRILVYTLNFTCQTYYYGPVKNKPIIKFVEVDVAMGENINDTIETITLQPGLTANGTPTNDQSISVPWSTINITDDYGFAFDTQRE